MVRFISFDCGVRAMACVVLDVDWLCFSREGATIAVVDAACQLLDCAVADIRTKQYVAQFAKLRDFVAKCLRFYLPDTLILVE